MLRRMLGVVCVLSVLGSCADDAGKTAAVTLPSSILGESTPTALTPVEAWAADLDELDRRVRNTHPDPFAIHPESEWVSKIAELKTTLAKLTGDEQMVRFASLVGLLDTHSSFGGLSEPDGALLFPFYQLYTNGFADGTFVVRAADPSLVGDRVVSIGGVGIEDVKAKFMPIFPADNDTGKQNSLDNWLTAVGYLHGLGIVQDVAKPQFVLAKPDETMVTVDPGVSSDESVWETDIRIGAPAPGNPPEAISRHGEAAWTRLDPTTKTFLIALNDYDSSAISAAVTTMLAALDTGAANRVVLDMRYLQGGKRGIAKPLYDALVDDTRINRPGGLVVMIGRRNESAATALASDLAHNSAATFVGEPTPARADNFLCECQNIKLPHSGFTVTVPTFSLHRGDTRDSISPVAPYEATAADYFAGRDPLRDAAMKGARG